MSSTLLEVTRAAHEDVERLERLIVKDLQNEPASSKDRLFQSHRVRNMIDTIISTTEKLVLFFISSTSCSISLCVCVCVFLLRKWSKKDEVKLCRAE